MTKLIRGHDMDKYMMSVGIVCHCERSEAMTLGVVKNEMVL